MKCFQWPLGINGGSDDTYIQVLMAHMCKVAVANTQFTGCSRKYFSTYIFYQIKSTNPTRDPACSPLH